MSDPNRCPHGDVHAWTDDGFGSDVCFDCGAKWHPADPGPSSPQVFEPESVAFWPTPPPKPKPVPTIADAIRTMGRALRYRAVWLGCDTPDPDLPSCLWENTQGYYSDAHLRTYSYLQRRAEAEFDAAVCGTTEPYATERLTPPGDVLRRAEALARQAEFGALLGAMSGEAVEVDRLVRDAVDEVAP